MARSADRKTGSTASAEEIARFAAVADSRWATDGAFRALHRPTPTRTAFLRDRASARFRPPPTARRPSPRPTPRPSPPRRPPPCDPPRGQGGRGGPGVGYRGALREGVVAGGLGCDGVLNREVVEHVADLDAFLDACCKLVKPGGVMGISTINRTLKALALAKVGAEYVLRWVPAGTHTWSKFVKPSELARGLRAGGVQVTDLRGMTYGPLTGEWALSRDLAVNYLAFAVKDREESA